MLNECVHLKLLTYSKYANVNYNYVVHEVFLSLFLSFFPNCLGWLDTHGGGGGMVSLLVSTETATFDGQE